MPFKSIFFLIMPIKPSMLKMILLKQAKFNPSNLIKVVSILVIKIIKYILIYLDIFLIPQIIIII